MLGVRAGRLRVASFPSAGATLMPLAIATLPRAPSGRRADARRGRARGDRAAAARRRVRPGAAVRVPGRARAARGRAATADAARGPDARGAAGRARARRQAGARRSPTCATRTGCRPRRPSPCARHVVRSCAGGGLRAEGHVRVRRLRDRAGARRGGRRGGADPAARADPRPPAGSSCAALAPRSPARRVVAATIGAAGVSPAARTMIKVLATSPSATPRAPPSPRPRKQPEAGERSRSAVSSA